MKKVAETVLMLAMMGRIRAGRSPTAAEKEMMENARVKLVEVCEGFAPKDAFWVVLEDLGLSKLKDQRFGLCSPEMSISQKFLLSKQKMEKLEEFSLHSGTYLSQRLQTNSGAPIGHVTAANSKSLPYQLPASEVKSSMASSGLPTSHLGRDSSVSAFPRVGRAHFTLDERSNGSSHTSQGQAKSTGDQSLVKTPTRALRSQSASSTKTGRDNNTPAHPSDKVKGIDDLSTSHVAPRTTSKPFITQTVSGNLPTIHMNSFQSSPLYYTHNEIGKIVQKLLQPQSAEQPIWTPPSRDYMKKALTCQICEVTINGVEHMLVCDACENGFHRKCDQSNSKKGIPRGEWHCTKCLTRSNGKTLPPKYGQARRTIDAPKMTSNTSTIHSSPH